MSLLGILEKSSLAFLLYQHPDKLQACDYPNTAKESENCLPSSIKLYENCQRLADSKRETAGAKKKKQHTKTPKH